MTAKKLPSKALSLPTLTLSTELSSFLSSLDGFGAPDYLSSLPWEPPRQHSDCQSHTIATRDCVFFKLTELRHDSDYPRREAMANVISNLAETGYQFVYLLSGSKDGVNIYLGVARNCSREREKKLHAHSYGKMLENAFRGNFTGSVLTKLNNKALQENIFTPLQTIKRGSLITGIPSINEVADDKSVDFQGIDRLITSMRESKPWHLLLVCEPVPWHDLQVYRQKTYDLYNQLHKAAKTSVQVSANDSSSNSTTEGTNESKSKAKGTTTSKNIGYGNGDSSSKGTSNNVTTSKGKSSSETKGNTTSNSLSATREYISKEFEELLKYLDEELLERLNLGQRKGMFTTATYALAESREDQARLEKSIRSIFQGNNSQFSPLRSNTIPVLEDNATRSDLLCKFQPWHTDFNLPAEIPLLFGHQVNEENKTLRLGTMLTTEELSLMAGLPTREVPGIPLIEGTDFGLNPATIAVCADESCGSNKVKLGYTLHRGQKLNNNAIALATDNLSKHIFIAGVTGSGKTTTCHKILRESGLPFMVIEPAKTEYRVLLEEINDLHIFTLGNESLVPFRFNPFEMLKSESITSHVDMLKAAFGAAFPLEAAMPYMLEEAIYSIYERYGWDISGSGKAEQANKHARRSMGNPWDGSGKYWPTMTDLLTALQYVVKKEGFDTKMEKDYQASLISRLRNLTIGAKGKMLNCRVSFDFEKLLEKKVIFEMDDLKDAQDKALMMGLILARMNEALKQKQFQETKKEDGEFQHLTLVEEAHRLLAKIEPGQKDSKGHAVDAFTDMLAEVRKYGEGLIIVDQIPNKLAPEVLKNTNTKIIHKLLARDDREVVGDTMGLADDQKKWLSRLKTGEAVVISGDWAKAIHIKIKMLAGNTEASALKLYRKMEKYSESWQTEKVNQHIYCPSLTSTNTVLKSKIEIQEYNELIAEIKGICSIKPRPKNDKKFAKELFKDLTKCNLLKNFSILSKAEKNKNSILLPIAMELMPTRGTDSKSKDEQEKSLAAITSFLNLIYLDKKAQIAWCEKDEFYEARRFLKSTIFKL